MTTSTTSTIEHETQAESPERDVLRRVQVRVPCVACGGDYGVTLRQVLLSQQAAHQGCQARHEPECPPVLYRRLADEGALRRFEESWWHLVEQIRAAGFEVGL
jgi:hypothetical protein